MNFSQILFKKKSQDRYNNLKRIQQLDPIKDHCEIYHIMLGYEFPWEIRRGIDLANLKNFCVPSISKLLDRTGEYRYRTQKRYDDTLIFGIEILKWGYDSDRGREAIQRMNVIHDKFKISNEDFLYVLSTLIYEPIRWTERFGWRKMCEQEKLAIFYFTRETGKLMRIQNIPETYEEFEKYNIEYEQKKFQYSDSNSRVVEAVLNLVLSWFLIPKPLYPLFKPLAYSIMDENVLMTFGFERPPVILRWIVNNILKLRGKIWRLLPPLEYPLFDIDSPIRSYPKGYKISELGPAEKSLLETRNEEME
jgi:hypothetical protein